MDDQPSLAVAAPPAYCCPGELHPIDHDVHLARLTAFYPACLACPHRHDTAGLTARQLSDRLRVERRASSGPRWQAESLAGTRAGDITPETVERFAAAVAGLAWEWRDGRDHPTILVGSDGTWMTADFLPAACRSIQLAGCRAVEVGAVTTPALSVAAARSAAEAALWIGNAAGASAAIEIRAWQADGLPASSPGTLDAVQQHYESRVSRATRGGGTLSRLAADAPYLAALAGAYHALRPLALVLDTTSDLLVRYWQRLAAQAACRLLRPEDQASPTDVPECHTGNAGGSPEDDRLARVAAKVTGQRAHLGVWVDGAGERCRFVDERGRAVPPAQLASWLSSAVSGSGPSLSAADGLVPGGETRQSVAERMHSGGAPYAADTSGRNWYAGTGVPDALATVTLVLSLLSASDRPLSEVLDAAAASG